jgi:hypothetical protein
MIARATAAMAPIRIILRGPIIKYGASCLIELIKTFLERDAIFALFHCQGCCSAEAPSQQSRAILSPHYQKMFGQAHTTSILSEVV